jgi:predicted Fe-Mo cluster-binding NifX family protein
MNFKQFYLTEEPLITENSLGNPIHATEDGIRNFWKWFSGSVMVDSKGRPKVYYHGNNDDFDEFQLRWERDDYDEDNYGSGWTGGNLGEGFYFTDDKTYAKRFGNVKEYYLKIENLYDLTVDKNIKLFEKEYEEMKDDLAYGAHGEAIQQIMKEKKYDGVIAKDAGGVAYGSIEIMVPKSKQIKLVNNSGKFSNTGNYKE